MPKIALTAYRLSFHSALHLSRGMSDYEQGQEILHADTLKAALFSCGIQLFGEVGMPANFLDQFCISSAYPYCGKEYFFPKPFMPLQLDFPDVKGQEAKAAKKAKKLQFIGKSLWEKLLHAPSEKIVINSGQLHQKGSFVSEKELRVSSIMKQHTQQRVKVPHFFQEDQDTVPYYLERIYFGEDCGLYFLTDAEGETRQKLETCLRLLGDNGIGTDRNAGNGLFELLESEKIEIHFPDQATHQIALSLYCPLQHELTEELLANASYQLLKRGGYMAGAQHVHQRHYRKKSVYMFTEGAVFPKAELKGKKVDLRPESLEHDQVEHPIWRDGQPLWIPCIPPPQQV